MNLIEEALAESRALLPETLWAVLIVLAGMAAAWGLHALLWPLILRIAPSRGLWAQVIPRLRRPARLAAMAVMASVLVNVADLPPDWTYALGKTAFALLIVIIGWMCLIALETAVHRATDNLALEAEDNLAARKQATQMRVLRAAGRVVIVLVTLGAVLASFQTVRAFGVSLFASAGAAGLVLGFAARPVLANLIAGIQIAITQPIRIDDVVIVEGEWGWIEEIASTYVVVRIWDLRRLVVPLSQFIEQPFQNWTRENAEIIGTVFWYLDYTAPIGEMREKLKEFAEASPHWDGKVVNLQVTETDKEVITVRALLSARNSPTAWDLRCEVREKMVAWLQEAYPGALPRVRGELTMTERAAGRPPRGPGPGPGPGEDGTSGIPEAALPEGERGADPDPKRT
ncbi:mechanosensitive ion channel family protein [Wenxinia saemankumensis]|uniref:Small-conductance mechanosensitive channel n=1 Tax=Wenxinia saemankumensis TaxID=1447782 RepID=A0A1M6CC23_9RHOB|nr:mechanosensitive ion channel domain-containing protein [Wenxinia saemankumensis]SHI58278.1 Small-conductance mechanosensitive channel [Wenxinia saemankumensis]